MIVLIVVLFVESVAVYDLGRIVMEVEPVILRPELVIIESVNGLAMRAEDGV